MASVLLLLLAVLMVIGTYAEQLSLNGTRLFSAQRYLGVSIGPTSWEYFRVELPPEFSYLSISLTKKKWSSKEKAPVMCFRFGAPPLPSTPVNGLDFALSMAGRAGNASSMGYCAPVENDFQINTTNQQIISGLLYVAIFSDPGPSRTRSTMIQKGPVYTFDTEFLIFGCRSWDFCRPSITPLGPSKNSNNSSWDILPGTCVNNRQWSFFSIEVPNFASPLRIGVDKGIATILARHAALPQETVYDFKEEAGSNVLTIETPRVGPWFFGVLASANLSGCSSVWWSVRACPDGRGGIDCLWPSVRLGRVLSKPKESPVDSNYYPREASTKSSSFSYALLTNSTSSTQWLYFQLDVPHGTAGSVLSMELHFPPLSSVEVYSRLGAFPTNNSWDFHFNASKPGYIASDIVYPVEGDWFIGLLYSSTRRKTDIKLQLFLHGCSKSCSHAGSCRTSYDASRISYFSFCGCDRTHGGVDCSETLLSSSKKRFHALALIGSNAAAIIPALWSLNQKAYSEWLVFTTSGVSSAIYHSCDAGGWCALPYDTLQFLDFWLSFLAVVFTCIYMVEVLGLVKTTLHIAAAIVTAIIAKNDRTSLKSAVLVIGLGALALLSGIFFEFCRQNGVRRWYQVRDFWRRSLILDLKERSTELVERLRERFIWSYVGIGVTIVVFAAFSFSMEKADTYWIYHSLWHLSIYTGAFFLLFSIVEPAQNDRRELEMFVAD